MKSNRPTSALASKRGSGNTVSMEAPYKSSASITSIPKKVDYKQTTSQGHHGHASSLRKAEINQLETFIKTRSQQLDSEINQLREKISKSGKLEHAYRHLLPDPNASAALNADIINQQVTGGKTETGGGITVTGTGIGRVKLQSQRLLQQSKTETAHLSHDVNNYRKLTSVPENKNDNDTMKQLTIFLSTLKLKAEDAGISELELRELLLPSDLMEPGEYKVHLREVTDVLQIELLFPLSKFDQKLILDMYGDEGGMVDVRMMLADAGIWHDNNPLVEGGISLTEQLQSSREKFAEKLNLSSSSKRKYTNILDKEIDDLSKSGISQHQTKQILSDTNSNVESLHNLHDLIMEEREWDDLTNSVSSNFLKAKGTAASSKDFDISRKKSDNFPCTSSSSPFLPHPELSDSPAVQHDGNNNTNKLSCVTESNRFPASRDKLKDLLASSGMSQDLERLKILAEENQRLKSEIAAFDSEFFEELEDLKYRYAKLQEVVGEDPMVPSIYGKSKLPTPLSTNDEEYADESKTSKLPLSRLAWSVRNSMRAIDRASDDSPLVQGPRIPSAYTYAPGVTLTYGDRNLDSKISHRSISAQRTEYETFLQDNLDDSVYGRKSIYGKNSNAHPYAMTSNRSGAVLDGGIHGIGGGQYSAISNDQGGNFANLCERRLVFELANQGNPYNATNEFLAKVIEVAERNRVLAKDPVNTDDFFISVPQLKDIMLQSRLSLSPEEITVLAAGFASDGKGSIDAQEFCDMVRTLLYNLTGSHYLQQSSAVSAPSSIHNRNNRGKSFTRNIYGNANDENANDGYIHQENGKGEERIIHPMLRNPEYRRLVVDLCETIITYDRQAVLGTSTNLMQTLLKPFVEEDFKGSGVLSFGDLVGVVKSLGSMFSYHEYKVLAAPFVLDAPPAESAYPSSNLNHIKSFREAKLSGALRGKAMTQSVVGDFLADHHLGDLVNRPIDFKDVDQRVHEESIIEYPSFVKMIVDELEALLEKKGGLSVSSHSRLPWVLKEMELVDVLITQLENMRATARRKVLITLQYALQNADAKQMGELDGFALLTTLLNCGFRLQRYHRVQLLKAAEEFGGTLEYSRLILTLLQTAIDWTHHEREIVLKILKAMGVTVTDRRLWLAKLKKLLLQSASKSKLKLIVKKQTSSGLRLEPSLRTIEQNVELNRTGESEEDLLRWNKRLSDDGGGPSSSSLREDTRVMIAPSIFLHVLRDCQVHLSPEEEATLLDCLDTERIARQEASAFTPIHHHTQQKNTARLLFGGGGSDGFNVPMVDFQSFLSFCNRHCGSWVDTKPHLQTSLFDAVSTIHNPLQALHEFVTLLNSFDEKKIGFISQRAFLICCHRARLLANLSEVDLQELTDILAIDGAGEIEYRAIVFQLRGMCSGLTLQQMETAHTSLLKQLLRNASDHAETLLPLRNWLLNHSDLQALILTTREFNALLREFSVLYRPEDLDLLMMEIGQEVDFQDVATLMSSSKAHLGHATGERRYDSQHRVDHIARTTWVVDTKKFLSLCLKTRSSWMMRNPRLAKHLLISLKRLHHKRHAPSGAQNKLELTLTIDGTEMAALEEVMGRIRAFASDDFRPSAIGNGSSNNGGLSAFQTSSVEEQPAPLIEADIFLYIVTNLGIDLTKEDVQFLCDASDPYPEAKHINPELLYDILHIEWLQRLHQESDEDDIDGNKTNKNPNQVTDEDIAELTDAAVYALDHLQQLVRKTQAHCGRNVEEWTSDLKCLFSGFDPHHQGFMTYEDFLLALSLLNVKISAELLKDIPYVGKNRGYVQYPKIVDYILRANPYGSGMKKTNQNGNNMNKSGSRSELMQQMSMQDLQDEEKLQRTMTIRQRNDALENEQERYGGKQGVKRQAQSPILALLRVVRKKMCGFIVSEANVEEAWLEMLRVFQRFDVTEQKVVSPRDFCLAVSVLLDDDNIVLTKPEWEEIIDYFVVPVATTEADQTYSSNNTKRKQQVNFRTTVNGEVAVDYMLFCEMVLDPAEVQKKLQDVKFNRLASSSAAKLDRAKDKLSTSVANKTRTGSIDRQRMQDALQPSSTNRKQAWAKNSQESIEDRFEKASSRYQQAVRQGREYGQSTSATNTMRHEASTRALGNVEAGSNSYRVAKTQGQASRDNASARLRTTPKAATVTAPSNQIYLVSKGVDNLARAASAGRSGSRLNKTS